MTRSATEYRRSTVASNIVGRRRSMYLNRSCFSHRSACVDAEGALCSRRPRFSVKIDAGGRGARASPGSHLAIVPLLPGAWGSRRTARVIVLHRLSPKVNVAAPPGVLHVLIPVRVASRRLV